MDYEAKERNRTYLQVQSHQLQAWVYYTVYSINSQRRNKDEGYVCTCIHVCTKYSVCRKNYQ